MENLTTDLCISASVASYSTLRLHIPSKIDDRTVRIIVSQVFKRNYRHSGRKSNMGLERNRIKGASLGGL